MNQEAEYSEDVLLYWRKKIFQRILRAILVLGSIAYVPSIIVSLKYQLWAVCILDTSILVSLILLYTIKTNAFGKQVFILNFILYSLGVGLLLYLGPYGAGWIWLFAFPILGTVLSGFTSFKAAMIVNFFTLLALGIMLHLGILNLMPLGQYSLESWLIVSINFLCMSVLFCYPIGILVKEMKAALDKEHATQLLLVQEQEALALKNKDLVRTNIDLDNFIYTASHDLKAPVSNIESIIDNLNKVLKNKDEETSFFFDLLFKSSNRLNNTIRDLTEISKTHQNLEGAIVDTINIQEVLNDILPDLKIGNNALVLDLQENYLRFSRKNLRSILYNLLSNASKYSSKERDLQINIRTRIKHDFFILELQDNGLGMAAGFEQKIFKMFKRMHDHVEGSGLGLYILNRIVENNGGKIEVESVLNKGTLFRVYLKTEK